MARDVSPPEIRAFLMQGTRTGKVATTRVDGRPHVAPIWFTLDGNDVLFTTHESSVKGKTLVRDPRVMLSVDEETAPYSFVLVEGSVTLTVDVDECRRWATVIGGRYMGEDRAEEYGARNGVDGEYLVRLTPTKTIAKADISD